MSIRLIVEGWRFLPHSYGVVDQFLCLELAQRRGIELFHRDLPFVDPAIQPNPRVLGDEEAARRLAAIPTAPPGLAADITVRLAAPLDLRPAASGRTLVFGTAEFGIVDPRMIPTTTLSVVNGRAGLALMTPSEWSRSGLIRGGADPGKVVVLPHGYNPATFRVLETAERTALRQRLGWDGAFVFLNIGALTANKGVIHLLKAFAALAGDFPHARLVIKGLDLLYPSGRCLDGYRAQLSPAEAARVESGLTYLGQTLSYAETAALYQAADAYVTPYHAEGFNLPVLEAAACGLPVVCTGGGPTDEFTDPSFALRIHSRLGPGRVDGMPGARELVPDPKHLTELMARLLTDQELVMRCHQAGPAFVRDRYTWSHITTRLLALLEDDHALAWQPRPSLRPVMPAARSVPGLAEMHARAMALYQAGDREGAGRACWEVLRQQPLDADAVYLLGVIALDAGRPVDALLRFHHATALRPAAAPFYNGLGEAYRAVGQTAEAAEAFGEAIRLDPSFAAAHNALGQMLLDGGDGAGALASFRAALEARPDYERAHLNLGRALKAQGDLAGAAAAFAEALRLRPDYVIAHNNLGAVLLVQGRHDEATVHLREAIRLQGDYPEAHFNLGSALNALGDPAAARVHFQEALRLRPDYVLAHHGLGRVQEALGEFHAALASYREAVRLKPDYVEGYESLGSLLLLQPDWEGARAAFERALQLQPDHADAFARLVFTKQVLCDWRGREADLRRLWDDAARHLAAGKPAPLQPLWSLSVPWSPAQQLAVARSHSDAIARQAPPTAAPTAPPPLGRLRVGYLSCEFRDHPVGQLMQGIFELHDREHFEIFAYSFGADDGSVYRRRIMEGCDHFRDLRGASLADSYRCLREDRLHVLIDLQGHTGYAKMTLLAMRPAPVQANYLGYSATTGAGFIDYFVGDAVVTPAEHATAFREQLVTLPHCYLATDGRQPIAPLSATRANQGLPEKGVVFCGFNNSHKIEPEVFDIWMRILRRVPGSVLWLSSAAGAIRQNLRREVEARGVAPDRLVFASRLPDKAEHLARHALADLFLDTFVYNAHTTACDALWAGLPVLTCPGETFVARVAASLLTAVGLPELIAPDRERYEELAVHLAQSPGELAALKRKLAAQRTIWPLFDTPRLVRNLERAYRAMWDVHAASAPPRPIVVEEPAGVG